MSKLATGKEGVSDKSIAQRLAEDPGFKALVEWGRAKERKREARDRIIGSLANRTIPELAKLTRGTKKREELSPSFEDRWRTSRLKEKAFGSTKASLWSEKFSQDEIAENRKAFAKFAAKDFEVGKELLLKGHVFGAFELFSILANAYLDDPKSPLPKEIGAESVKIATILARSWVLAQAIDYLRIETIRSAEPAPETTLKGFELLSEEKGVPFSQRGERTYPSNLAVEFLSRFGSLEDRFAIEVIHQNCWECNLEGTCSTAMRRILSRGVLTGALLFMRDEMQKFGISAEFGDESLVDVLEPLVDRLGITRLFYVIPGLANFYVAPQNPVDEEIDARKIEAAFGEKFDAKLSAEWQPFQYDNLPHTSERFALAHGFIEPTVAPEGIEEHVKKSGIWRYQGPYRVTPKGKEFLRALLAKLPGIQVAVDENGAIFTYRGTTGKPSLSPKELPPAE